MLMAAVVALDSQSHISCQSEMRLRQEFWTKANTVTLPLITAPCVNVTDINFMRMRVDTLGVNQLKLRLRTFSISPKATPRLRLIPLNFTKNAKRCDLRHCVGKEGIGRGRV
jgi:hypothetical protein